jgi:hypothetical protein
MNKKEMENKLNIYMNWCDTLRIENQQLRQELNNVKNQSFIGKLKKMCPNKVKMIIKRILGRR